MSTSAQMFLFGVVILQICSAQTNIPFLNLLTNGNIGQLTQMATRLAASAAEHTIAAQKDTLTNPGRPEPGPLTLNSRPSEFIGQSFTNAISPTVSMLDEMSLPSQLIERKSNPSFRNDGASSLIDLANAFLGGPKRNPTPPGSAFGTKQFPYNGKTSELGDPFPTLRQIAPGANNNFGMPKGEGCLPFLSEFMRAAYGNCVREADEKTWDAWGSQITNALSGRNIDILKASKETCKRGAERQQCGQLRKVISECDILGSLQVGMQLQRAIQRCEEISGIIDQNPVQVLDQVNSMIGGEFAQGFLHKFLG